MMLLCGLAMISTSCNKEENNVVPSEVENGTMAVGTETMAIQTADAATFGNQNAIILANKAMTEANNEGIAIVFNGDITSGTYTLGESRGDNPTVIGLKEFNMGELPFAVGTDTIYFGDVYLWVSGQLSITVENGTYTVVLSQCVATNAQGNSINLSINYNGTLTPFVYDTDNKFVINGFESPIALAGITSIGGMSTIGEYFGVKSMLFMSADHKRSFIVSYVGNESVDGTYQLGYFLTPYVPVLPCVHVATDFDFWSMTPQTGYIAQSGTLKVTSNDDGTKSVTMENLKLKNLEHGNEFFPILDASLQYHGYMYEIGQ